MGELGDILSVSSSEGALEVRLRKRTTQISRKSFFQLILGLRVGVMG